MGNRAGKLQLLIDLADCDLFFAEKMCDTERVSVGGIQQEPVVAVCG